MPPEDESPGIEFEALTEALFRPELDDDPDEPVRAPTDLEHVGPATATVIEAAPFEARDVAAKRVSYRELVDAGVDPVVAERLRRAYSLVWTFEWRIGGEDLPRRAEQVRGLGAAERAWIAGSVPVAPDRPGVAASDGGIAEAAPPSRANAAPPGTECERCGGRLATYALGERRAVCCEECDFVGVGTGHR